MSKTFSLYGGDVKMVFDPDAPRYRYKVTDSIAGLKDKPMRGVTTLMGEVIDKPGLRMFPMDMAMGVLFGQKYDDEKNKCLYDASKARLQPNTPYTAEELQKALDDARAAHTVRSQRGKDVGSLVHGAIEAYLKKKEAPALPDDLAAEDVKAVGKAIKAFTTWWESLPDKEVMLVEAPVYSRYMGYAGTCDLVAKINGKVYMLDIKTTNRSSRAPLGIYPEMFLQLGAYSYAVREERGYEFFDLGIINVGKDGRLAIATARDMGLDVSECERAFAFACRLHDWLNKTGKLTNDAHFKSHLTELAKVDVPGVI